MQYAAYFMVIKKGRSPILFLYVALIGPELTHWLTHLSTFLAALTFAPPVWQF